MQRLFSVTLNTAQRSWTSLPRRCAANVPSAVRPPSSAVPRVTPQELHWVCRSGESPIILDARPAREHDVFRIVGAISIPADSATTADIEDMPRDRPVYIHGSSDADGEIAAVSLAAKILALPRAPKVHILRGGPNEIRQQGFIYLNDVEGEQRLLKVKQDEAKAAAAAAAVKK